jgi:hypothetical protein
MIHRRHQRPSGHVKMIPAIFFEAEQIDFKNDIGYIRDYLAEAAHPGGLLLIVGAAYSRAREPSKFMVPMMVSMWLMGFLVIGFFLYSEREVRPARERVRAPLPVAARHARQRPRGACT